MGIVMFTITEANLPKLAGSSSHIVSRKLPRALAPACGRNVSDEALIEAIAQDDRSAMALLYGRHNVRVYRFILRMTGDATLAEDLVSEVFLEVWRHADEFQARSQVSTWLLAIARNKLLSALRRHCDQQLDDQVAAAIEDPADDPEVSIQKKDRSTVIQRCLSQLSQAHREVVDLVYYHEKSLEEVAQIVGAPLSTIKTRMFYARQRIEKLLKAAGFDERSAHRECHHNGAEHYSNDTHHHRIFFSG
jgi:RNA polymerase sigma-70 factor, ECF subfamily